MNILLISKCTLFTGRPGSHDSGFSQCMRLSNVCSVHEENLSTPQCSSEDNQYIDMKGQAKFIPPNKHIGKRGKGEYSTPKHLLLAEPKFHIFFNGENDIFS